MSYITGPNVVRYACTCGILKPISYLYFCRYCTQLRCSFCVCHEVDSNFCGKCSENIPSSEARVKKNRCGNCYICPSCEQELSPRIASTKAPLEGEEKVTARKMYYLFCQFCRWSSRDVGIPDQSSVTGGWPERENVHTNRLQELIDLYKAIVVAQKQQQEKDKKKQRGKFVSYTDRTGVTAAALRKRIGLPADLTHPLLKSKPKEPEPAKSETEVEKLPDDIFTKPLNLMEVTTIEQRLLQPESQPITVDRLFPVHKQLSIKRTLRCRTCEHNVSKPEYNPSSVKFKIQLFAYYHIPEIRIVTVEPLRAGTTSELILKFTNPTQHQTTIDFSELDLEKQQQEVVENKLEQITENVEHLSIPEKPSLSSQPSSLLSLSSRSPSIVVKPRKISETTNSIVEIPSSNFILPPRDDAAEYDDSGDTHNIQDDTKLVKWRKSNKAFIKLNVTPDADLPLNTEVVCGFTMQHIYTNAITGQQEKKEPQKYNHKVRVFLTLVFLCKGAALCLKLAAAGGNLAGGGNDEPPAILDWGDREGDRFSFEDSDRFEEDSLCSWSSEPESVCNNWRGWKKPSASSTTFFGGSRKYSDDVQAVPSLTELAAKCVASHIPFELVEHVYPPVPEQLQLRIAFWSFPDNEEDIRLYSCLANGSAEEFSRGDGLHRTHMVKDPLQIGFHLSASVQQIPRGIHNVAVTFDRRRISSCNCTCTSTAYWCSHVVAVCLTRIHWPHLVTLRAPVSESLSRLQRDQLQKFAQYLISELPQQILPTAQRLLDELLGSQPSAINSVCGAPDPTAGASANDQTSWYLDEKTLHDNIKKILIKFCVPAPIVFSDVNYLSTVAPPAAAEWTSLLRPLRGREPEGMWNLLSIVREMFKRNDRNAIPLLEIITEECLACEQILIWWFNTKVALLSGNSGYGGSGGGKHNNVNSNTHASQHACSSLCDEVVVLWRLAALNPGLAPTERDMLHNQFSTWHMKILEKVSKCRNTTSSSQQHYKNSATLKMDLEVFTGFKPAIEACYLDWDDYPMPGITYTQDINPMYHCPFTCFRHGADTSRGESQVTQVNSSKAVLNCEHPHIHTTTHSHHHHHHHHHHHAHIRVAARYDYVNVISMNPMEYPPHPQLNERDGNRSSVSSEGFCEVDDDMNILQENRFNDSDSQEGGGSDSSSNSSQECRTPPTAQHSLSIDNETSKENYKQIPTVSIPSTSVSWTPQPQQTPISRRDSKDDSTSSSNSDSPQSGDEYNMYFYNSKDINLLNSNAQINPKMEEAEDKVGMFSAIRKCDDPWDVLFARAEGLHAHGHSREACILGVKLAEELLMNPPDLMIEIPPIPKKKGKKQQVNPASHQLSCLASATLSKCAFLCSVLAENSEHYHLAFRVGMFGLEMARPPASTKPLEVKLANQETDLVNLLKRIPLGHRELQVLRERAELLKEGTLRSRGEAMLPIMLASFIFDALVIPNITGRDRAKIINMRMPTDELLGFEAAVAALGLKANVSEADHPLLCEGTRRQRGDLAIALLVLYKDDCWKMARIMDRLLDKEVHQLMKTPLTGLYYSSNPPTKSQYFNMKREDCDKVVTPISPFLPPTEMMQTDMACCSRPHSATSAELEQGMGNLSVNPQQVSVQQGAITRTKDGRYKGKRAYPSIPNQPSEAGAHFMFELAKNVLNKAGGTSSTSLFTQASTSQNHHGPHRALHMCAFQLGLYALGLHNCVSPNWLSRTYSSHVSWTTGQAMEIGTAAISFLIDTWEGHLTPPEAASIADRASRGCDVNMVRAAAELALSCLPHAQALNPNEIQRAILQCKEQSDDMLEHACHTVEGAAKGGGVYPEVLFQVAKYWYELYVRHTPGGDQLLDNDIPHDPLMDLHGALVALIEPPVQQDVPPAAQPVVVTTAPPYTHAAPPVGMYVSHYNFVPHPHHPPIAYGGPLHPLQAPPPTHVQMYQFPYPPPAPQPTPTAAFTPVPTSYATLPPPQQAAFTNAPSQYAQAPPPTPAGAVFASPAGPQQAIPVQGSQPPPVQYYGPTVTIAQPVQGLRPATHMYAAPPPGIAAHPQQALARSHRPHQFNQTQLRYLLTSYRVGMLALETLARRVHDDRPQAKYARNPPYGEDVKWLLRISKHLGTQYLHHFCVCVVNSIVSPFVLHDVAIEAAQYLSRNNPSLVMQHLRTALTPLVQKCQQMYIQCMHQKLYHLTASDYEDFVSIVCTARAAFQITPDGSTQFKEWLQSIRRSKSCKKDLWTQINTALQANNK